jgi:putative salt-induced outer membrane protein YdiY
MAAFRRSAVVLLLAVSAGLPAAAEEGAAQPQTGWSSAAEFAYVATSGNADTMTLGFTDKSVRSWTRSSFQIDASAVRAESTTTDPIALDLDGDGDVDQVDLQKDTQTTAERYLLQGRYDRKITDRFFWFAGAGWDRNQPAGIENRYAGFGGVGHIWRDDDRIKFRTDYAVTYTDQEDVVPDPSVEDTFLGARLGWSYLHNFAKSTAFEDVLVLDENLDETSDFRVDFYNAVAVTMTETLALKVGLRLLYDNEPAIDLIPVDSTNPGAPATFPLEKDDLDTIFTASLVVKF